MELVTIKNKFQIVIPQSIREQAGVDIGDLLEAKLENGKITFTPKSVVDRHLAEGLQDLRDGRTHRPYKSAGEAIASLDARIGRRSKKPK